MSARSLPPRGACRGVTAHRSGYKPSRGIFQRGIALRPWQTRKTLPTPITRVLTRVSSPKTRSMPCTIKAAMQPNHHQPAPGSFVPTLGQLTTAARKEAEPMEEPMYGGTKG